MQIITEKYAKNNYFCQRAVASLAEGCGVPITDLPLDASIDTKLHVLNQLSQQLEDMLEHFTMNPNKSDRKTMEARWLYLNDSVLQNATDIYTNNLRDVSEMDAATRAFYKIKATSGQMQKGVMIANAVRNLKREDAKNILLYRLSQEQDISSTAYEVAGISSEMAEWKSGKAERYAKSIKMTNELKMVNDTEKIKKRLRTYLDRVGKGLEQENEFLSKALIKTYKQNSSIGKALEEMDRTERNILLKNNTQTERYAKAEA